MTSQYHDGEREAQRLAGEAETAEAREGMVQSRIAAAAIRWLNAQTLLAIATLDDQDRPWASLVVGKPGFVQAEPDGRALWVDHTLSPITRSELKARPQIGVLAIDLSTRQRMRVNGSATLTPRGLHITVAESFFNCPKYITRRIALPSAETPHTAADQGTELQAEHLQLLHETDVLFLATTHSTRGLDASHRGGDPGFVQLLPDGRIRIPDYPGNSLFNSLGNLLLDPHVGLAVPNLRTGSVLQITGTATITWNDADPTDSTGGTHRFVDIAPQGWRTTDGGPVAGATAEPSPFNPHAHVA